MSDVELDERRGLRLAVKEDVVLRYSYLNTLIVSLYDVLNASLYLTEMSLLSAKVVVREEKVSVAKFRFSAKITWTSHHLTKIFYVK